MNVVGFQMHADPLMTNATDPRSEHGVAKSRVGAREAPGAPALHHSGQCTPASELKSEWPRLPGEFAASILDNLRFLLYL